MEKERERDFITLETDNFYLTLETLDKIANALNVHITELFEQPQSNEAGITCPHCGKSITIKVE